MNNYVVWDIETCQADTSYCTFWNLQQYGWITLEKRGLKLGVEFRKIE